MSSNISKWSTNVPHRIHVGCVLFRYESIVPLLFASKDWEWLLKATQSAIHFTRGQQLTSTRSYRKTIERKYSLLKDEVFESKMHSVLCSQKLPSFNRKSSGNGVFGHALILACRHTTSFIPSSSGQHLGQTRRSSPHTTMSSTDTQNTSNNSDNSPSASTQDITLALNNVQLSENNDNSQTTSPANPPQDPSASRPVIIYTRKQMLALSKSPLVKVPDKMPPFKTWYGYVDPSTIHDSGYNPSNIVSC
jgi:hypothetical protein